MITGPQCRMARAALRWDQRRLAREADVHPGTIKRIEDGKRALSDTLQRIERAFREAGVGFGDDGSVKPPPEGF